MRLFMVRTSTAEPNCILSLTRLIASAVTVLGGDFLLCLPHRHGDPSWLVCSAGMSMSTAAGVPLLSGSADGPALSALFHKPQGLATDGTLLYISEQNGHTIRVFDTGTGDVTLLAGMYSTTGTADGVGDAARFNDPRGLALDGSTLYVADHSNHIIRSIALGTDTVTTIAGTAGTSGSTDDTTGTSATFNGPDGLAMYGTTLYVADKLNHVIRAIDTVTTTWPVTTLAGVVGTPGSDDGPAGSAKFDQPDQLVVSGDFLYVSQHGIDAIRTVDLVSLTVETLVGGGTPGGLDGVGSAAQLDNPGAMVVYGSTLYFSSTGNSVIRRVDLFTREVTTFAGLTGSPGYMDSSDPASMEFDFPMGLALTGTMLYVADFNNEVIRVMDISGTSVFPATERLHHQQQCCTQFLGSPLSCDAWLPAWCCARRLLPARLSVCLSLSLSLHPLTVTHHCVHCTFSCLTRDEMCPTEFQVSTVAGTVGVAGSADGPADSAEFDSPYGMALSADNTKLYISEYTGHTVRVMDTITNDVTLLAGMHGTPGGVDDTGGAARFSSPGLMALDGGQLYVADRDNHAIRSVDVTTGSVITVAGTLGVWGSMDGMGPSASFDGPEGLLLSGTTLYVAEVNNHIVRSIDTTTWDVTTLAGTPATPGYVDGPASSAQFDAPVGMALLGSILYVSQYNNHVIRTIHTSFLTVGTLAGSAGTAGTVDGFGTGAQLHFPIGIVIVNNVMYVSEYGNHAIRSINLGTTEVTVFAGQIGTAGADDGDYGIATFAGPAGLVVDGDTLLVSEFNNHAIRRVELIGASICA